MALPVFLLIGLVFAVFVAVAIYSLLPDPEPGLLQQRLGNLGVDPLDFDEIELNRPLKERAILPLIEVVGGRMAKNTKSEQLSSIRQLLRQAGSTMNPESFLFLKVASLVGGGVIGFLGVLICGLSGMEAFAAVGGGLVLGYMYPASKMKGKAKKRAHELLRALPGILDLLTISMEAGLAFDMAMARVCEEDTSPLGREFQKALNEIRLGRPRSDALTAMAERNGVDELSTFIRAVVQAEPLGVSIANVLRIQSEELRRVRRQKAEEKGHKAPVKMLLPMMGCIFPCVFILLLGPAALQVMKSMGAG